MLKIEIDRAEKGRKSVKNMLMGVKWKLLVERRHYRKASFIIPNRIK